MRQRNRDPLDVPTPVAVALADFCRRAGAPVDPRTVRDALSILEPQHDPAISALAAQEPSARPLGPFAVVEMVLHGVGAQQAAQRQERGEWADVRLLPFDGPSPAEAPAPVEASAHVAPPPRSRPRPARAEERTVLERVAPKRRKAGEPRAPEAPAVTKPPSAPRFAPVHKRQLPKPRGRFLRVDQVRLKAHRLHQPQMKEELSALIAQHGHRVAICRALDPAYIGAQGKPLSVPEVEAALLHHDLREALCDSERQLVVTAVVESRGDLHRSAVALGMSAPQLDHVILNCGAHAEVTQIREHHAREALAHGNLRHKLELLERPKYLVDLGVEKRFREALALELKEVLDRALPGADDLEALLREASRLQGLPYDKLKTAVDRAGLTAAYRRRLAS